jgi:hypothetical protein
MFSRLGIDEINLPILPFLSAKGWIRIKEYPSTYCLHFFIRTIPFSRVGDRENKTASHTRRGSRSGNASTVYVPMRRERSDVVMRL